MSDPIVLKEEYDVVIVGAGASGSIVAHQLAKAGRKVLVLEAGRSTRDDEEGWASNVDTFHRAVAKVPNSAFPATQMAPQLDVLQFHNITPGVPDSSGYAVQHGPLPFGSDNNRSKGGTTLHWTGIALRMLPNDFRMQTQYGVGVDWPISYDDMKPYYELAEQELGVSGCVEEYLIPVKDKKKYWGDYQYPMKKMPQSYVDLRLKDRVDGLKLELGGDDYEVRVVPTPQARNSDPNPDYKDPVTGKRGFTPIGTQGDPLRGERCQGNSCCPAICPSQAKYSGLRSLNRAIAAGAKHGKPVTVRCQSVVSKVITDPVSGRVTEIEYITYEQVSYPPPQTFRVKANVFVISAHSIETAKLLLMSGIGNSSDQVGRNLMDHPTMLTWGLMPEPVYPFRGPAQTSAITAFRDGAFRKDMCAFVLPIDNWGWIWSSFSPEAYVGGAVGGGSFGRKLRQSVAHDVSRQIALQWEFEQLPDPGNRVTIDQKFLDPLGLPRPQIHYRVQDYTMRSMEQAMRLSAAIFKKAGITDFTRYQPSDVVYTEYKGNPYTYRGCGHIVGTHRMGKTRVDSVTDSWLRSWDHQNLFLVGCGAMPTWGTSNPSLTMSALAFRAAEAINKDLDKQTPKPR
ncbi:MAG: GMC family oxidoreductase [Flavobacteriales bacterium]|nr:GMC family oxidoreductase [Flavobacteriales bacterium]